MTPIEIRDRAIAMGIEEVNRTEEGDEKIGGVVGFKICRFLLESGDFDRIIMKRNAREVKMIGDQNLVGAYWRSRSATAQIERIGELLAFARARDQGVDIMVKTSIYLQYMNIISESN